MDVLVRTTMISVCGGKLDRSDAWRHIHRCKRKEGNSKDVDELVTRLKASTWTISSSALHPTATFLLHCWRDSKRLLLADKNRGSFCSEHSAPARIGYMDGSWMALLFHLCTLSSPVHFAQKLCHVEWVTCEHSEPATKRSQLSISSAANLLISVCKNFSKIVVEVFNSGQRMVKTVLVHILHPSSPLRLMMEWIATIQKILIPL